jgi:putative transposase
MSIARGCELMGTARSTYYEAQGAAPDDATLVAAISAFCDEFEAYGWRRVRAALRQQGVIANPYDNAKAESFMKTLKVEAVYPMAFKSFEDVATYLPNFIEAIYNRRRLHSSLGDLSPEQFEDQHAGPMVKTAA